MDRFLTTKEAAELLGIRPNTLEHWRSKGKGPTFERVGSAIRYRLSDIELWLTANRRG